MSDLDWLLLTAGAALLGALVLTAGYGVGALIDRRKPAAPTDVFCVPEPGAEPVEAAWVSYAGRDASGTHVFLACFPISPAPEDGWEVKFGRLPHNTEVRFMFGTEQTGVL